MSTTFFKVEHDLEFSSKKMRIVLLSTQLLKAKDKPSSSIESITEKDLNPSTHPRTTPHLRKDLLKLRTSTDSSNSDGDNASLMKNASVAIQMLIAKRI